MRVKHILLIDDNEADNYVNRYLVEKSNIADKITVKKSAIEALEFLATLVDEFPNVIFLDIRMPEMDGFEFMEKFEEFPPHLKQQCTVYMLSSSLNESDIERATQSRSIEKFLHKPLNLDMLSDLAG